MTRAHESQTRLRLSEPRTFLRCVEQTLQKIIPHRRQWWRRRVSLLNGRLQSLHSFMSESSCHVTPYFDCLRCFTTIEAIALTRVISKYFGPLLLPRQQKERPRPILSHFPVYYCSNPAYPGLLSCTYCYILRYCIAYGTLKYGIIRENRREHRLNSSPVV